MDRLDKPPPLNAMRVFVAVAREMSVTRAAAAVGITQSAASRHLAVLEAYLGGRLIDRRGRHIALTTFGQLFFDATAEAVDSLAFAARRLRHPTEAVRRLIVRTSLPTFAYSTLIPNLPGFSAEHGGATVDVMTSGVAPGGQDQLDVFITREVEIREPSDRWELLKEQVVCVASPVVVAQKNLSDLVSSVPVLTVTSRPDLVPHWANSVGISLGKVIPGPRYDHHFLAIPAAVTGQGLLVVPEIVVPDLLRQRVLVAVAGSRAASGALYHVYAVDRAGNHELARAFCRWVIRLCRQLMDDAEDLTGGPPAASA
jgi:LysR family glycine cleavage system transcriptional activator